MDRDWFGIILGTVFALFIAVLIADGVASLASRPAQYACYDHNLRPVRLAFSARVACVSRNTGADTVTVNQVPR